jgi:hypothetical protein
MLSSNHLKFSTFKFYLEILLNITYLMNYS